MIEQRKRDRVSQGKVHARPWVETIFKKLKLDPIPTGDSWRMGGPQQCDQPKYRDKLPEAPDWDSTILF